MLREWGKALPSVEGRCAVIACVGAMGAVWEIAWRQRHGDAPAGEAAARGLARALVALAEERGFKVLFEPWVVVGAGPVDGEGERIAAGGGAEFILRRHGDTGRVDAMGALEAARELSERSVVELSGELQEILRLSQEQCQNVELVAKSFDSSGGLDEALSAVEQRMTALGQGIAGALRRHRADVEQSAQRAHDIVGLAAAVEKIAQSARLLTFNARLESARLGEAGKGFVVIAGAIRELANDVRTSNELVSSLASDLATMLPRLQTETAELAATTDSQLAAARARLASLREAFQAARQSATAELEKAEAAASDVKSKSHDVIRHLQFQDRASQLLARVKAQVESMEVALGVDEVADDEVLARVGQLGRKLKDQTIALEPGEVTLF